MLADVRYSICLVLCNALLRLPGHQFRVAVLRRLVLAEVGERCAIQRGVRITTRGGLRIGDGTIIGRKTVLEASGGLTIGRSVNISAEAILFSGDHDPQSPTFTARMRPTVVGDRAWVAARAIVMPGTEIGEGVIVAAGAVALGRIPARTIVAGNPAVPIGERDPAAQSVLPSYRRFLF